MSWQPAKSLVRFTCVCKPWLSLICDSTSAHTTAKPPLLLRHFSLPPDNLRSDAHAVYAHGMLVFLKLGQEHSVELLREEKEKRIILHKKRIALLGEEEAKKLQQEDYEREQRLLDRVLEKQTLDTPLSISELPVDPKIKEMPALLGDYACCFGMLVFPKPGQGFSMELLREERERRLLFHKNQIVLLGTEEVEKLQKEDYEREQHLLDQTHKEGSAKREKTEQQHHPGPKFVELTSTQRLDYEERLRKSGVFDVGDIPAYVSNIPVRPFVLGHPLLVEMIEGYAKSGLEQHNKYNNTKYQFVKVLKANIGGYSPGWNYYITSQVKDVASSGSPTLNFQAKVNSIEDQEAVTSIVPEL
ncbi:uncharacterized protein LOC131326855 [Rhododendron vialii]|uniref:uncharacterized protein LOC131326855 n=1 Tax=Rhododendron vialii TaxID=182163 RepID=UPI0026601796|nr:uncharacterized protein LOC131326855 [Rhododendron vialii]XP_058215739.1 uncharacterized protein LOC131326855 [Rhododendron vialii]